MEIDGIEDALLDNVRATSGLQRLEESEETDAAYLQRLVDRTVEQAKTALEPFGYYNATVAGSLAENAPYTVTLKIEPGPTTQIESVTILFLVDGVPVDRPEGVEVALRSGEAFQHSDYENLKRNIQVALLEAGYLDALLIQHQVDVRRAANLANIKLQWKLGSRYRFGDISYTGSRLKPELLNRYADFETGDYYRQSALALMHRGLLDSGYFDDVQMNIQSQTDQRVDIIVALTPRAKSAYELGATFGTDTGPGVEATHERRWINTHGHTATLEAGINQRRFETGLVYGIPRVADANSLVNVSLGYVDEDTDTSKRKTTRLGAQRLGLWGSWRRTDGISLLREKFDVGSDSDTSSLLIPSVALSRDAGDDSLIPDHAWRLRIGLSSAVAGLLSDVSFARVDISSRWITTVFEEDRLLLRARLGATWTSDFNELPASLRYFAGGDRSIRGYDFEALGPLDSDGQVEGGKYLLTGSLEYEKKLRGAWRVAAFVDGGNALNSFSDDLELGAGLGIRYATPVGLIRLDVASSLSQDEDIRLHFSIGPDL